MKAEHPQKLYYSIGEVSKITELPQSVLRYWETEFRQLSPSRNKAGKRVYRDTDIDRILQIKGLLYEKRYTIEGANHYQKQKTVAENQKDNRLEVEAIRKELTKILKILDK